MRHTALYGRPPPSTGKGVRLQAGTQELKLTSLSTNMQRLVNEVQAWEGMRGRYPNVDRIMAGGAEEEGAEPIGLRAFRHLDPVLTRERLMAHFLKDPAAVRKLARWWLAALKTTVDRTLPLPEGHYCTSYMRYIKRNPDADQVGLRRWVSKIKDANAGGIAPEYLAMFNSDYHLMDRQIAAGQFGPDLDLFHSNRALGGEVEQAYRELLDFAENHWEPRTAMLAKVNYGARLSAIFGTSPLRHVVIKQLNYYKAMWRVTQKPYYADEYTKLADYYKAEWQRVKLPDGREGLFAPHGVNPLIAARGSSERFMGWHNTVYLETTVPAAMWDAVTEDELQIFDYDALRRLANGIYHCLPKFGWTEKESRRRLAANMGGGGANPGTASGSRVIQFTDGSAVPAEGGIGSAGDADDMVVWWRGLVLGASPWSDIPDMEAKVNLVRADQLKAQPARAGLHLTLMLYQLKKEGKLPGVR
jgi:hypothetical protein